MNEMKFSFFVRRKKKNKGTIKMDIMLKPELSWIDFYFVAISIKLASYFYSNLLIQDIYDLIKHESFEDKFEIIQRLLSIFHKRDIWIRIRPVRFPINLFESYSDRILINNKFYYISVIDISPKLPIFIR